MILTNSPQNEAIMSNVGEIGEFRIRNSAKAFNILSSGLYANKVRAIIRELSCNAIDSHAAANNSNTPYDVHLPTSLEPWFSIRDYGTGLSHDQVTQIFTTYFESTKTNSNEFIGALGLGSKSPFSYTDNFTVTAVKDGIRGIYTAFINEGGIPSIAKMASEETKDPSGVEIKFSVNDRYDFRKFADEAREVYKFFKQRPVIAGFEFEDPVYSEENIIPGVHTLKSRFDSFAIMGNIVYPIDIPEADTTFSDDLRDMLTCGLVMEFKIGELDFQASREGLSYIPQTIESIKNKLIALNAQLSITIADEANKIDNLWERAYYLNNRLSQDLWKVATKQYVIDTEFPLLDSTAPIYNMVHRFKPSVTDLAENYNIVIQGFSKSRGYATCTNLKTVTIYDKVTSLHCKHWDFSVNSDLYFVFNTGKIGAANRAKNHWRNKENKAYTETVLVISAYNKNEPIKRQEFLDAILNPPASQVLDVTDLQQTEREAGVTKNASILRLKEKNNGWGRTKDWTWSDSDTLDSFDEDETYYYLPLSGFACTGVMSDVKHLRQLLEDTGIWSGPIYGVRKADIEAVKAKSNWKNLDSLVIEQLKKIDDAGIMSMVKRAIDFSDIYHYNISSMIDPASPYLSVYNVFKDVKTSSERSQHSLETLCRCYSIQTSTNIDGAELIVKYRTELADIKARYPLLSQLSRYYDDNNAVADYINMTDKTKGI